MLGGTLVAYVPGCGTKGINIVRGGCCKYRGGDISVSLLILKLSSIPSPLVAPTASALPEAPAVPVALSSKAAPENLSASRGPSSPAVPSAPENPAAPSAFSFSSS